MSSIEIPLLRESAAFASRLVSAARAFGESRYHFHRRVNWSYRYAQAFYDQQRALFQADPDAYLRAEASTPAVVEDVYSQRLPGKQVGVVLAKVTAHWLFHVVGRVANRAIKADAVPTYRKGYVDDIELVFDPAESGVVRAIYPFPLNVRRQLRYLLFLHNKGLRFKLAGNPYGHRDLARFILRRDVRSLMRLESRAQLRHAREVVDLGVKTVQLSDEFDIGSLDFARALARTPVCVVNSAHGVGAYLPVHAYQAFETLTVRQQQYYLAVRPCRYSLRRLNDRSPLSSLAPATTGRGQIDLVFLGQTSAATSNIIAESEARVSARLQQAFGGSAGLRLLYKPHPNRSAPFPPPGFQILTNLQEVNGRDGTVFVSFFSTCQIDPAFKGRKLLLRDGLIHPEIVFDDAECIVDVEQLVVLLEGLMRGQSPGALP